MDERQKTKIGRRNLLIGVATTGVAATIGVKAGSWAETRAGRDKGQARYQSNSPEVQTFYRVNRYPAKA
jgi:hypothetical protein